MASRINRTDIKVGRKIRMTRQFREIDIDFTARYLNLSNIDYMQYEAGLGRFSLSHLILLSTLFRVSIPFLIGKSGRSAKFGGADIAQHASPRVRNHANDNQIAKDAPGAITMH